MELPEELKNELWEYCRVNEITNMDEFKIKLLKNGFTIEKYGSAPANFGKEPKEVIKEVIKEVEVEKIVEKEVIREVPVEKEVYITDDTKTQELVGQISSLESLLVKKEVEYKEKLNNHAEALKMAEEEKKKEVEEYEAKIKDLEEQLSKKNNKPDIYGGATFGSNLMD